MLPMSAMPDNGTGRRPPNSAALAGGVHETDPGIFGRVRVHGDGQIVSGDRLADRGEPFFPLPWAVWLPIGVQKSVPAQRTAAALGLEQTQGGVAQRGWVLPTPVGPVGGQGWVVRGRRAWHQLVPYDFRPGEFRQVGAAARSPNTHRSFLAGLNRPKYWWVIQDFGLFLWLYFAHLYV